jgi:hypothetical protein
VGTLSWRPGSTCADCVSGWDVKAQLADHEVALKETMNMCMKLSERLTSKEEEFHNEGYYLDSLLLINFAYEYLSGSHLLGNQTRDTRDRSNAGTI